MKLYSYIFLFGFTIILLTQSYKGIGTMYNYKRVAIICQKDSATLSDEDCKFVEEYINAAKLSKTLNDGRMMKLPSPNNTLFIETKRGEKLGLQLWNNKFHLAGKWYTPTTKLKCNLSRYCKEKPIIDTANIDFIKIIDRNGGPPQVNLDDMKAILALLNSGTPTASRIASEDPMKLSKRDLLVVGPDYYLTAHCKNLESIFIIIYDKGDYSWVIVNEKWYDVAASFTSILAKYIKR